MLTVEAALEHVAREVRPLDCESVVAAEAVGRVLAEDVVSDVDSPPHDKSIVDGYAVRSADLETRPITLTVLEEVVAGAVPTKPVTPGTATRIMTGAPVPDGAEAIVMVESTQILPGEPQRVVVDSPPLAAGRNVLRRGASMRQGEVVLRAGHVVRPVEIGLLSEVGRTSARVVRQPSVAVFSTGNELVPPGDRPSAGQIRNSNGPMLLAAVRRAGGKAIDLGIGRDEPDELHRLIVAGLSSDMLVMSGGVSAGVLDLVPGRLRELGVREVFHKVRIKPGKPVWFGVREVPGHRTLVFGLPGNPASSLVGFELFVGPAIRALSGRPFTPPATFAARLAGGFDHRGERATYYPARLTATADGLLAEPLPWQGSADLRTLSQADGLIHFPAGERAYAPGEKVLVSRFET